MNQRPAPFPIAPLRLTLRSAGLVFPGYSGREAFAGRCAQCVGARIVRAAVERPEGGREMPLQHHAEAAVPEAAGGRLTLDLKLFGDASQHLFACTQAIALLGEAGIDPAGRFQLERASVLLSGGEAPCFTADDGLLQPPPLTDFSDWLPPGQAPRQIEVRLLTPLRIKGGGDLLRQAADYGQLLHRLFGRLDQLAHVMGSQPPLAKGERAALRRRNDADAAVAGLRAAGAYRRQDGVRLWRLRSRGKAMTTHAAATAANTIGGGS